MSFFIFENFFEFFSGIGAFIILNKECADLFSAHKTKIIIGGVYLCSVMGIRLYRELLLQNAQIDDLIAEAQDKKTIYLPYAQSKLARNMKNVREACYDPFTRVANESLEKEILDAFNRRFGVAVLQGPVGMGKTSAVLEVANKLFREGKIAGVFYIPSGPNMSTADLNDWFRDGLGISRDSTAQFNEYFVGSADNKKPVWLIFDQLEAALGNQNLKDFFRYVAVQSENYKNFKVLALCASQGGDDLTEVAEVILSASGVGKVFRIGADSTKFCWTETMIFEMLGNYYRIKKWPVPSEQDKNTFFQELGDSAWFPHHIRSTLFKLKNPAT